MLGDFETRDVRLTLDVPDAHQRRETREGLQRMVERMTKAPPGPGDAKAAQAPLLEGARVNGEGERIVLSGRINGTAAAKLASGLLGAPGRPALDAQAVASPNGRVFHAR